MITVLLTERDKFWAEVYGQPEIREDRVLFQQREREIRRVAILVRAMDKEFRTTYIFHEAA